MDVGLTIGEFSQITHLSIKTLRRYHDAGLLQPARVDSQTGYRYYSLDQVPAAQVIHRFRELGMPLREVGELLAVTDPDARAAVIAQHLQRLENQLDQTKAAVSALRRPLDPHPAALQVRRRRAEATTVAAVRGVADRTHILHWYAEAMGELDAVLAAAGASPTGPPGGLYDNELFGDERGTMVVYIPVAQPPPLRRGRAVRHPRRRTDHHNPRRPARRHRRHLRSPRNLRQAAGTRSRRPRPGDLPPRPARHGRQLPMADRDRMADLPDSA
jgi:DNA-binding transcriptional MerR regulator